MTAPVKEPLTIQGLQGSVWARREEATRALDYLSRVEAFAAATQVLEPHGRTMAEAVLDARDQAVEAILLWRTSLRELERFAEAEAHRARRMA